MPAKTSLRLQRISSEALTATAATVADEYIQYGCGFSAPDGWSNFDASRTLVFERLPLIGRLYTKNAYRFPRNVRYGDIVTGLPVADDSARGVYASHVLEHLAYDDAISALRNTYRLLRPGGTFRLVVPDLESAVGEYVTSRGQGVASAAHDFMESTALGRRQRPRGVALILYGVLNSSAHLWMWDFAAMEAALAAQGFHSIRRCRFNDHEDPMFQRVEDASRFAGALAMEARR